MSEKQAEGLLGPLNKPDEASDTADVSPEFVKALEEFSNTKLTSKQRQAALTLMMKLKK
jgi:hypothetical protein